MSGMTETDSNDTLILAGRAVRFIQPTQGQIEMLIRIARSTQNSDEPENSDFWLKQVGRIGDLLEQLIAEGDRDAVDDLYIKGKINHSDLIKAILAKMEANAVKSEDKAIAKAKTARVARK